MKIEAIHVLICFLIFLQIGCGGSGSLQKAIDDDDAKAVKAVAKWDRSCLSSFSFAGDTPLMEAMEKGSKNAFVALLENGADPNRIGYRGKNLMTSAAGKHDIFWLKKALEYGGDPNLDNHGHSVRRRTPLIASAQDELIDAVKLLAEGYNADLNYVTDSEDAITHAVASSNFRVVLYLLNSGADFRRKTGRYSSFAGAIRLKTPELFLQDQKRQDFQAVIDWLRDRGVEWNKPVKDGDAWVYSEAIEQKN